MLQEVMAHPCGTARDMIRRPFRSTMKTSLDLPPVEVCWHFAPKGAKWGQEESWDGSRDWEDPHWNYGLGDQWPYDDEGCRHKRQKVDCLPCVPFDGQHRAGSDRVWSEGGVVGRDPVMIVLADGSVAECRPPVFCALGGESEGGPGIFMETCDVPWACRWFTTGGESEGGPGIFRLLPYWFTSGGEVEGGPGSLTLEDALSPRGGEVEGGPGSLTLEDALSPRGGEVEGGPGELTFYPALIGGGGEAEGGPGSLASETSFVGGGGEAEGGPGELYSESAWETSGGEVEGGPGFLSIGADVPTFYTNVVNFDVSVASLTTTLPAQMPGITSVMHFVVFDSTAWNVPTGWTILDSGVLVTHGWWWFTAYKVWTPGDTTATVTSTAGSGSPNVTIWSVIGDWSSITSIGPSEDTNAVVSHVAPGGIVADSIILFAQVEDGAAATTLPSADYSTGPDFNAADPVLFTAYVESVSPLFFSTFSVTMSAALPWIVGGVFINP